MAGLKLKVQGIDTVAKNLRAMQKRAARGGSFWDIAGAKGFKEIIQHFRDETGPRKNWDKLKFPRKRGGTKVLQDTGRLRNSIRWKAFTRKVILFTTVRYAPFHNEGTKNIPKRELCGCQNTF